MSTVVVNPNACQKILGSKTYVDKTKELVRVKGITRVTYVRNNVVYSVVDPVVYESLNKHSGVYVVFGEAKEEDMAATAQQMAANDVTDMANLDAEEAPASEEKEEEEEEEEEEEVDADGVEEKDIELVTSQANVSRNKAIKALKNNKNDIVNAIMELTM